MNKLNKSSESLESNSLGKRVGKVEIKKVDNLTKIADTQSEQTDFSKNIEDVKPTREVEEKIEYVRNTNNDLFTISNDTVRQEIHKKYVDVLVSQISQFKKYPKSARLRGLEAVIIVKFKITYLGELISYEIVKPSLHKILNKSVEALMQRAFPVTPVPTILRDNRSEFEYNLPIEFRLLAN